MPPRGQAHMLHTYIHVHYVYPIAIGESIVSVLQMTNVLVLVLKKIYTTIVFQKLDKNHERQVKFITIYFNYIIALDSNHIV